MPFEVLKKDLIGFDLTHNDAFVISIQIAQAMIERFHVDEGNTTNILQLSVVQQMSMEAKINKSAKSLTGFNGETLITVGMMKFYVYYPQVINA
ncbi:unnamed protein product [Prunus brigantina]